MSDIISSNDAYQPTPELADLVDKMIDDRLNTEERDYLEALLEKDESSLAYCAERLHLHAAIEESMTPVRVELTQKKHVVLEKKDGQASVSKAQTNVVRIDSPKHGKSVEFPPNSQSNKTVFIYAAIGTSLLMVILVVFWMTQKTEPASVAVDEPKLEFRNASFDDLAISEKSPPYILTILEWQDYFQGGRERVCDVERYTDGKRSAKDGDYAVYFKGGFLTQRLTCDDGSAFVAEKGLKVRVTGWAMLEQAGEPCPLSIATRVVTSPYPAMQQVEPSVATVMIDKDEWQKISVVLTLPTDSLVMKPQIQRSLVEGEAVDITGLNLAISIDNRSSVGVFLDAMSIELVE